MGRRGAHVVAVVAGGGGGGLPLDLEPGRVVAHNVGVLQGSNGSGLGQHAVVQALADGRASKFAAPAALTSEPFMLPKP